MEFGIKKLTDLKTLTFVVWGLKTSLGHFGPKAFGYKQSISNVGISNLFPEHSLQNCHQKNSMSLY